MSGRHVHLLAAAALAAAASLISISAASAGCFSCGPTVSYAPVVTYQAPVVYSQSYAQPYSAGCGCAAQAPMYVVNQGPAYTAPVTIDAEPTPAYEEGYQRAYPYYGAGGMRWHHRHWHRGYGFRGYGHRGYGYHGGMGYQGYGMQYRPFRGYGHRFGMRTFRPHIGFGRFHRGEMMRPMHGPRFAYGPHPRFDLPHRAQRMHMMGGQGGMHPHMMGGGARGPMHPMGPRGPMMKKH